jgi:hypothetical protein
MMNTNQNSVPYAYVIVMLLEIFYDIHLHSSLLLLSLL